METITYHNRIRTRREKQSTGDKQSLRVLNAEATRKLWERGGAYYTEVVQTCGHVIDVKGLFGLHAHTNITER